MRTVLFLCAAFALSITAELVEEMSAAQERHPDEDLPVQMLDRTQEEEPLPVETVGGQMQGDVKKSSCPSGWSKYGSRCFIFIHREMSWVDAERHCIRNDANLASIHNPGEYDFIQEVVRGSSGRFTQAWLGGNDAVKDYAWLWSDGTGFYFQDWTLGEPDNNEGNEKCIAMNRPDDFLWGDMNCDLRLPFVCGTKPV